MYCLLVQTLWFYEFAWEKYWNGAYTPCIVSRYFKACIKPSCNFCLLIYSRRRLILEVRIFWQRIKKNILARVLFCEKISFIILYILHYCMSISGRKKSNFYIIPKPSHKVNISFFNFTIFTIVLYIWKKMKSLCQKYKSMRKNRKHIALTQQIPIQSHSKRC